MHPAIWVNQEIMMLNKEASHRNTIVQFIYIKCPEKASLQRQKIA